MNLLSFVLALFAIAVFALASRGYKHATISIGLALLTAAWVIQLIWVGIEQVTIN